MTNNIKCREDLLASSRYMDIPVNLSSRSITFYFTHTALFLKKQLTAFLGSFILEKSIDPRKIQKARKYSKRYQAVGCYPKGAWLCNTTY